MGNTDSVPSRKQSTKTGNYLKKISVSCSSPTTTRAKDVSARDSLFTNINRNAKQTGAAENIALDEDDGIAILTRRLLEEHPFLQQDGRVRVILSTTNEGGVKLATNSIPKTDSKALTSFTVLYDVLNYLAYDSPSALNSRTKRPAQDVLNATYNTLSTRLNDLFIYCGNIRDKMEQASTVRDLRAPKNAEQKGHPFLRPIVQKAVAAILSNSVQQGLATWDELMHRLAELPWSLNEAPWIAVCTGEGKMLAGKDHTDLLRDLLQVHLAPVNLVSIRRARKRFKDLRSDNYPISEEDLAKRISFGTVVPSQAVLRRPVEISETGGIPPAKVASDVAVEVSAPVEDMDNAESADMESAE